MTEPTSLDYRQFELAMTDSEQQYYARGSFAQRHHLFLSYLNRQVEKGLMTVELDAKRGRVYHHLA